MLNAPSRAPLGRIPDPAVSDQALASSAGQANAETRVRITQIDVARAAGVHSTTVSLALRNSPAIPLPTRQRIQAVAEKLGYSPDPALRALAAYRKSVVTTRRAETIAYVTQSDTRWGWREISEEEQCFLGAQQKAAESGYRLEHFWLGEPGLSARRLSNMFFHRAITGVLIAAHEPGPAEPLDFDWDRLTAVKVGRRPHAAGVHRVTSDPAGDIRLAVRQARKAGFQRIALILPREWDDLAEQAWSMGFAVEQRRLPVTDRIPILFHAEPENDCAYIDRHQVAAIDRIELGRWLYDFQPDILIGSFPLAIHPLTRLGVEIPRDVAFIDLVHQGSNPRIAGVHRNYRRIGEVAVDLLIGQRQLNLRGLPSFPTTTLVGGAWCDGASIHPAAKPAPRESPDDRAETPIESSAAV